MNQTRITLIQTSISISSEKIKFFCESHNRKEDNNFMQNNHRRSNQCRFKTFFVQVFCQVRALNFSESIIFSLIFH